MTTTTTISITTTQLDFCCNQPFFPELVWVPKNSLQKLRYNPETSSLNKSLYCCLNKNHSSSSSIQELVFKLIYAILQAWIRVS